MQVINEWFAGLDVHKKSVTACARVPDGDGDRVEHVATFATFHHDLIELRGWLAGLGVTQVAMESTGVFWKPVWWELEETFELLLVNARHVHNLPGRKTDVSDAAWLAQLGECGLLRGSFVPDPVFRELRELTRYRRRQVEAHTREGQRLTKILEDAGIKLDSVASKALTVSGREMIEALCDGERDPVVLADLARTRMRAKIPQLQQALAGRFGDHHALMCRLILGRVDDLETGIRRLDQQVATLIEPFASHRDRLCTVPGVAERTAEVIIAEIGVDMDRFPTAAHLASWAGMCPGNNESAGKRFSGRTRPGNQWLRAALTQAAWAASRSGDTYLRSQFWRIAGRRGKNKAAVAVGHSILVIAWHILADQADYHELGGDWFAQRHNTAARQRWLVAQLEALGNTVTLTPAA
jgi:transposase